MTIIVGYKHTLFRAERAVWENFLFLSSLKNLVVYSSNILPCVSIAYPVASARARNGKTLLNFCPRRISTPSYTFFIFVFITCFEENRDNNVKCSIFFCPDIRLSRLKYTRPLFIFFANCFSRRVSVMIG